MIKRKDRLKNGLSFWCAMYPVAVLGGLVLWLLRLVGFIDIRGLENFPVGQRSVLVVSNHPSLWEPIVLIGLFFPRYVFHPLKYMPWSTPDQCNYIDKWYWRIFGSRFVSVPRGERRGELRSITELIKVLRIGGNAIFFPEGGRTGKGKQFLYSRSSKSMRPLKCGIGRVICQSDCTVVPVWVDGSEEVLPIGTWFPRFWRGMKISIGEPFRTNRVSDPKKSDFEQAVRRTSDAVLEVAG